MKPGIAYPDLQVLEEGEYVREKFLGSSNAAAVVGLGAYGLTPYKLWLRKTGQAVEQADPDRERFLTRRKRFEPLIVQMLREEFSAEIVSVNEQYVDPVSPFFTAECDFTWRDPDTGRIEHGEIKTVSPFAYGQSHGWGDPGSDEVPIHYAAQCQFAMGVTGASVTAFGALVGFDTMLFYTVPRDNEVIQDLRAKCRKFWQENVLKRIEPEPIVIEDLDKMLLARKGKPAHLDAEARLYLETIFQAREAKNLAKQQEEDAEFKFLAWLRNAWDAGEKLPSDNALLVDGGQTIATFKQQSRSQINSKLLKEEKPDIYRQYLSSTTFRVLRKVKPLKATGE